MSVTYCEAFTRLVQLTPVGPGRLEAGLRIRPVPEDVEFRGVRSPGQGGKMKEPDEHRREMEALRERLDR